MVVALRLGNRPCGKIGKSTIINQLLNAKNVFSSCVEPLAERAKPISLDGTVEFVCLTKETASPKLWESVLQEHYKSGRNELIMLANLHGNAINHQNILKFLAKIASSFIIFIMPDEIEISSENELELEKILDPEGKLDNTIHVAIDPPDCEDYDEDAIIETQNIASDRTIGKLRAILKCSMENPSKKFKIMEIDDIENLKIAEFIETSESRNLIKFIYENSCENVKRNLPLQKGFKCHEQCAKIWSNNDDLKKIMKLFGDILSLNIDNRIKALSHLEKELGRLSAQESSKARKEFLTAVENLQKTLGSKIIDSVIAQQWKLQANEALKKIDDISLGLEHFFREIGKLYELFLANNPKHNPFVNFPKKYAELLIAGQAIELLDGDSGTITGPWLRAICENVYQLVPNMRIFVISILGLQSSGKSTLLNAMFSCKFAVSVGRCTRGLFMRLLFLEESLRKRLNFDAILLIDTEGLGAPEKQNELDAEKKDRLLATFVMGVSHLTIVNVLGEYMRDLTEILQIAIVAIARLEKCDISPDILMVQHLTERNTEKISSATQRFGESLENALKIADERDVNLGVRDSKCLNNLRQTIALGKLFRQFRPFKNGASVNSPPSEEYHQDIVELYKSILDIAEKSTARADFKTWQELVRMYWEGVKNENFMRFKDVKDLQDFLQRGDLISKVKESIESAFKEHSETLKGFIAVQAKRLNKKEVNRDFVLKSIQAKLKLILQNCSSKPQCDRCSHFIKCHSELHAFVEKKPSEYETNNTIWSFIDKTREWYF
jgi:ribosome biogenesis GTPase A